MISSLWPWALGPLILPYCFIVATTALFFLLWAYWPSFMPCQPILLLYSLGFLDPFTSSLHLFTLMGLLLNSLGLLGPFTLSLPLITLMGLLAIIPVMSTRFTILFFGLPRPIYFFFTSFSPMGLLLHSLGILGPFISSLPFVIFMGLLAINLAILAHWACFFISLSFCPSFSSHLLYCWASSALRPFVKNGHQQHVQCMWKFQKRIVYNSTYIFN